MEYIKENELDLNIINKNKYGIIMVRDDNTKYKGASSVSVIDDNEVVTTYSFRHLDNRYENQLLNWVNLDCCGGWPYNTETLINQVKDGKKPFAHIVLNLFENKEAYLIPLIEECSNIDGLRFTEVEHWSKNSRMFMIMKEGSLDNYINIDEVLDYYYRLGLEQLDEESYSLLKELMSTDMIEFATENNKFDYNFRNAKDIIETIFTGLLLGYPIESTADRIYVPFMEDRCIVKLPLTKADGHYDKDKEAEIEILSEDKLYSIMKTLDLGEIAHKAFNLAREHGDSLGNVKANLSTIDGTVSIEYIPIDNTYIDFYDTSITLFNIDTDDDYFYYPETDIELLTEREHIEYFKFLEDKNSRIEKGEENGEILHDDELMDAVTEKFNLNLEELLEEYYKKMDYNDLDLTYDDDFVFEQITELYSYQIG